MEELLDICDYSYDSRTGGCDRVDCKYHIEHYVSKPTDWYIFHRITAIKKGECLQQGGTQNG